MTVGMLGCSVTSGDAVDGTEVGVYDEGLDEGETVGKSVGVLDGA